jgi:fido (protein-threonine AMPylation protein)
MKNQDIEKSLKGHYRRQPVWVGGREGVNWMFIPAAMEVWCMNCWLFPKQWKAHHIRFEKIHPFIDGNGRMGRMLMNWERAKSGLPVKIIWEAKKGKYYEWFK